MQLLKFSIKFEENGKWSEREADLEGYLVKKNELDDTVEGYVKALYSTNYPIRYVKGLYCPDSSLVFMQLTNAESLSPICYCFPNISENGYWSPFNRNFGFFPIAPGEPCSLGHASIRLDEVTSSPEIEQEASSIFAENAHKANWVNHCLMGDYKSIADFLGENWIFQMQLHCGKW